MVFTLSVNAQKVLVVGTSSTNSSYSAYMVEIQKIADEIATLEGFTSEVKDIEVVTTGSFDFSGYDAIVITEAAGSSAISKIGTYTDVVPVLPVINMKMYAIHDGKNGWNWCPNADFFGSSDGWDSTKVKEQAIMKIASAHEIFGGTYAVSQEVLLFSSVWKAGAHYQGCTFENSAVNDIKNNSTALGKSTFIETNSSSSPSTMMWAIEESATCKRNVIWGLHSQFSDATDDFKYILKNSVLWILKKDVIKKDTTSASAIEIQSVKNGINIFPNPATTEYTVQLNLKESSTVYFSLYDLTGKIMFSSINKYNEGTLNEKFDVSEFTPGIYLMSININNNVFKQKLIIM